VESDIAHVVVVPSLGYNNMVEVEEEEEIDSDGVILKNLMNQCLSVE
jgi:hypothetical protein